MISPVAVKTEKMSFEYASSFEDVVDDVGISSMPLCEYLARIGIQRADFPTSGLLNRLPMGGQTMKQAWTSLNTLISILGHGQKVYIGC